MRLFLFVFLMEKHKGRVFIYFERIFLSSNFTPERCHSLYASLVRPHLDYASSAWNSYHDKKIATVERITIHMLDVLPIKKEFTI